MKAILTTTLALAFCLLAQAGNFEWTWKADADGLKVLLKMPEGVYVYASKTKLSAVSSGAALKEGRSPSPVDHKDPFSGEMEKVFKGGPSPLEWSFPSPLPTPLSLTVEFQGCREASEGRPAACFLPQSLEAFVSTTPSEGAFAKGEASAKSASDVSSSATLDEFKIARQAVGYMNASKFSAFLSGKAEKGLFEGKGFLAMLLLAFAGGMALNLTPCVLPMIPVNLAIIGAGAAEPDKRKSLVKGLVYGAGMAVAYGVLGLAAAIGGASFGQINSYWEFNILAGLLFAALALAMFEVFTIDVSRYGANARLPSGAHFAGVFVLGAFSAVLAGACVAPVVIAVLLHSASLYAEGELQGLALPFVLGLGMAAPWPLAAAGLASLPKPGRWMLRVKQALGVLIALLAVYYLWTGGAQIFRSVAAGDAPEASPAAQIEKLENALKASLSDGKPALVDFQASWCKNCEAMEATSFQDAGVKEALKSFHVVKFQAEDPSNSVLRPVLERLGVAGLPTFMVLERKSARP